MREVQATWINDDGDSVGFISEMSDMAIHDLICLMEAAQGIEDYEEGDFVK